MYIGKATDAADKALASAAITPAIAVALTLLTLLVIFVDSVLRKLSLVILLLISLLYLIASVGGMSQTSNVSRLSVSLPTPLVKEFDNVWRSMQYADRSKAVHDALRNFISEHRWMQEKTEQLMGAIVLVYYPDKPGLLKAIMDVQHEFESIISSTMHVHLTRDKCLEIIAVKGKAEDTKVLTQKLMAKKGVKELKFAAIAP